MIYNTIRTHRNRLRQIIEIQCFIHTVFTMEDKMLNLHVFYLKDKVVKKGRFSETGRDVTDPVRSCLQ